MLDVDKELALKRIGNLNSIALTDEAILSPFVMEKYGTYLRNLEGVIEHSYYHLGQIAIIKKQIKSLSTYQ